MPAIKLYGRRWHFGTDVIPLPAALAFAFHFSWLLIMLALVRQWPGQCESWEGVAYTTLFSLYFASFATASIIDAFLFYNAIKGAPFEEKKRKMVVPLLYIGTGPLLIQAAATLYGTWVAIDLQPDCWESGDNTRNAVKNFAQALVFINWAFCFLTLLGIAIFYNMYPDVHQKENWEQRCACIATLLCCRRQVEKPIDKGQRPPLKNIAELAAGILSHIDVDATDLAAAVVLTSAAQQRRRRLRIAKALLPVYRTLREGQREFHDRRQQQNAARNGREASERGDDYLSSAFDPGSLLEEREIEEIEEEQEEESDGTVEEEERISERGRKKLFQRGHRTKYYNDDSGWVPSDSNLTRALTLAKQATSSQAPAAVAAQQPPFARTPTPTAVAPETKILDSSTSNVAALHTAQKLEQLKEEVEEEEQEEDISPVDADSGDVEGMSQAAAELVAEEITAIPTIEETSPADTIDQLTSALQQEVEQLYGEGPEEESVVTIRKEDSLDLTNIRIDPGNPMIWVHPNEINSGSDVETNSADDFLDARSLGSSIPREIVAHVEGRHIHEDGKEEFRKVEGNSSASIHKEKRTKNTDTCDSVEKKEATSALAAVAEEARDTPGGDHSSEDNTSTQSSSFTSKEHSKLPLERQITLQHPTVITPSAHVQNFSGPLSPETFAEICAGRHERVPSVTLKSLISFLRYAYAVYALHSRMENPSRNHWLNRLCFSQPDPQSVVLKSLSALGEMVSDESVELLHLNCSNRVLAHIPYLIALDHAERAVVISLRGTIGIADLVTDAVVHPEKIDDWLPSEVAEKLGGAPALAHAGMVAAARAVFEDMTERGILRELVQGHGEEAAIEDLTRSSHGNSSQARAPTQQKYGRNDKNKINNDGPQSHFRHYEDYEEYRKKTSTDEEDVEARGAGRAVGDIMRKKVEEEGWQLVVVGHSLGAGAASLISLKLHHYYPQLKCLAFSCPGGLVSKKLSHGMRSFCTTIAVGKDFIPRASVATITRLMDELVTSLARCKQPKIRVLFVPWWHRHSQRFKDLFYNYDEIPEEAAAALLKYYESRRKSGKPIEMYPPGKISFLRPIKSQTRLGQLKRSWDAVYIAAEDLMGEGILVSPNMLKDHLTSTIYEALTEAKQKAESAEERREGFTVEDARQGEGVFGGVLRGASRAVQAPWSMVQVAAQAWGGEPVTARQGSLEQKLVTAV